jgi:hypothetical protein
MDLPHERPAGLRSKRRSGGGGVSRIADSDRAPRRGLRPCSGGDAGAQRADEAGRPCLKAKVGVRIPQRPPNKLAGHRPDTREPARTTRILMGERTTGVSELTFAIRDNPRRTRRHPTLGIRPAPRDGSSFPPWVAPASLPSAGVGRRTPDRATSPPGAPSPRSARAHAS